MPLLTNPLELVDVDRIPGDVNSVRPGDSVGSRGVAKGIRLDDEPGTFPDLEMLARRTRNPEFFPLQVHLHRLPRLQTFYRRPRLQLFLAIHGRQYVPPIQDLPPLGIQVIIVVFMTEEHTVDDGQLVERECGREDRGKGNTGDGFVCPSWAEDGIGKEPDAVDVDDRGGSADVGDGDGRVEVGSRGHNGSRTGVLR